MFKYIINTIKFFKYLKKMSEFKFQDYKDNYKFIFLEEEKQFNLPIKRQVHFIISETTNYYITSTFSCELGNRLINKGFNKIQKKDLKELLEWSNNFDITSSFDIATDYISFKNIIKIER